jgi:Transcriptional regulatory protein, C terminal
MAYKDPGTLGHAERKRWPSLHQGEGADVAVNQNVELGPQERTTETGESLPVLDDQRKWPPAIWEMLESDSYRVAFVRIGERDRLAAPHNSTFISEVSAALLPFSWRELIAQVHETIRDFYGSAEYKIERFADICVDLAKMEVTRAGKQVRLTTQEFKTLKFLMQNSERVISRDELLNEVWGYQNYPSTRTVDNHILKLRQKLERDPARPIHFRTVQRAGYKFVP